MHSFKQCFVMDDFGCSCTMYMECLCTDVIWLGEVNMCCAQSALNDDVDVVRMLQTNHVLPYVTVCYRMLQTKASVPAVTKVPFQLGNWVAGWKGVHIWNFSDTLLQTNKQTYMCVTTLLIYVLVYRNLESKASFGISW